MQEITQFVRFEDRGFGLVAVFRELGCREFSLCENGLKERIANLAKYGHPCSAERSALAEMERMSGCAASCAEDEDKDDLMERSQELTD